MSYLLPHLHSGWAVDQAILAEEERLVVIRFGHDWDETCMQVTMSLSIFFFVSISYSFYNFLINFDATLYSITTILLIAVLVCLHGNLVVFVSGIEIRVGIFKHGRPGFLKMITSFRIMGKRWGILV